MYATDKLQHLNYYPGVLISCVSCFVYLTFSYVSVFLSDLNKFFRLIISLLKIFHLRKLNMYQKN